MSYLTQVIKVQSGGVRYKVYARLTRLNSEDTFPPELGVLVGNTQPANLKMDRESCRLRREGLAPAIPTLPASVARGIRLRAGRKYARACAVKAGAPIMDTNTHAILGRV